MAEIEVPEPFHSRAVALDRADRLAALRDEFLPAEGVVAYLDGNSLGRPLRVTAERTAAFLREAWGTRLIRAWDEGWMDLPTDLGDRIARHTLGAAAGQTVVGDSTTVLLYKLLRAAVDARPGRDVIIADTHNFPSDRFVIDGVARERGLEVRWLAPDPHGAVTPAELRSVLDERVAVVELSHVAYRSGAIADLPRITRETHAAGALMLWDLCHSTGVLELALDADEVDLAVGCTYKYLNGGPGAPAFAYVAARLQEELRQPIQGWMGAADPFAMGPVYEPAAGIRRVVSGTPPIMGMLPLSDMLALLATTDMRAIREKSVALTAFTLAVADERLAPLGVTLASPREPERRGGHVMLEHPAASALVAELWEHGVIPDFRPPHGLRIGLSPLSTSFVEVAEGLAVLERLLARPPRHPG
ncbi:MAG TPA: aminotransferase class V-fold PLP-dependent enzyme [Solirubrobacteraceae bacterium]|nr:aminotransferase class V-fold PLP-dependent enzyme [Solirubrobacteraceae bacterium]